MRMRPYNVRSFQTAVPPRPALGRATSTVVGGHSSHRQSPKTISSQAQDVPRQEASEPLCMHTTFDIRPYRAVGDSVLAGPSAPLDVWSVDRSKYWHHASLVCQMGSRPCADPGHCSLSPQTNQRTATQMRHVAKFAIFLICN